MPQDNTMRAQLPVGGARKPLVRIIDGVPHEFDPTQVDGPTGGWIPQTGNIMPPSATAAGSSAPTFVGPPRNVISRTPRTEAEDRRLVKEVLTGIGATAGSMALGPEVGAPWLLRAALGLTGSAVGGAAGRTAVDVPPALYDVASGKEFPADALAEDATTGALRGTEWEGTALGAGKLLGGGAKLARTVGRYGLDVMPQWVGGVAGKLGIPATSAQQMWRPATAALRALAAKKLGYGTLADIAGSVIPYVSSKVAPVLDTAAESPILGGTSKTLGERAGLALKWLEDRAPGFLKADAPVPPEPPLPPPATFVSRDAAPFLTHPPVDPAEWPNPSTFEQPIGGVKVDPATADRLWNYASNVESGAADVGGAVGRPVKRWPVPPEQQQWNRFSEPARGMAPGELPIGRPAADPGIELNLTGPNVLPPHTAEDLAAAVAAPETASQRLAARAAKSPQELEAAHARMKAANDAAREAAQNPTTPIDVEDPISEPAAAAPAAGPRSITLPDGSTHVLDDAAAEADAANYDPAAALAARYPELTGDPYAAMKLNKATAQERRLQALTNKAVQGDKLPESSGLRGKNLGFDPQSGEIVDLDAQPEETASNFLKAATKRKP